jgi:hypothetical protein
MDHETTSEQWLAQALETRRQMLEMIKELQHSGFKWNATRGCWVHPDGTEIREG